MGLIETPLSKDAPDADRAVSACQVILALCGHYCRQIKPQITVKQVFGVPEVFSWTAAVSKRRVNAARSEGPAVAEHCVLCPGSVVCFFPVCCKGPLRVRGERGEWRSWDPLHSWEEAPPIESTEAECSGARQDGGLKALSLVHCLRVAPGFLATRSDCSEPARREKESTKALVFLSWCTTSWLAGGKQRWLSDARSRAISGRLIVGTRSSDVLSCDAVHFVLDLCTRGRRS